MHFRRITSIYQPTNAHIISYKTLLKHFKTLRYVSILSDNHQGALFVAKVIIQYSQFNSYLQTRCCGSISCCVGMCCGAVTRCASYDAFLALPKPNVQQSSNTQPQIPFQNLYCNLCFKKREWAHVTINSGESAFYRKLLVNIIKKRNFQPSNPHQVRFTLFRLQYLKKKYYQK